MTNQDWDSLSKKIATLKDKYENTQFSPLVDKLQLLFKMQYRVGDITTLSAFYHLLKTIIEESEKTGTDKIEISPDVLFENPNWTLHGDVIQGQRVSITINNFGETFRDELKHLQPNVVIENRQSENRNRIAVNLQDFPVTSRTIAKGDYLFGSKKDDPLRFPQEFDFSTVHIPVNFQMGLFPVTVGQFREFVRNSGYSTDLFWSVSGLEWLRHYGREPSHIFGDTDFGSLDQPMVGITWFEADAYCRFLTLASGEKYRLPTELEWEVAARGENYWQYPWGNEWRQNHSNTVESQVNRTSPRGAFTQGKNNLGCEDMAGNVYEWCLNKWSVKSEEFNRLVEIVENYDFLGFKAIRGGCWYEDQRSARCTNRRSQNAQDADFGIGFRILKEVE